jgi:hypothetical protein
VTVVGLPPWITGLSRLKLCDLRSKMMGVPGSFAAKPLPGVTPLSVVEPTTAVPLAIVEPLTTAGTLAAPEPPVATARLELNAEWPSGRGTSAIFSGSRIGLRNAFGGSFSSFTGLPSSATTRLMDSPLCVSLKIPSFKLPGCLPALSQGWIGTKPIVRWP